MSLRLKHIRLTISVLAMMSAIAIITILLVAYGQGYVYDYESGEVTSSGLAVVDSRPSNADIWINGEYEGTTSDQFRLRVGEHQISIDTDGYRQWQRTFSVRESEVVGLEYPLLIPERVVTTPIINMDKPDILTASPSRDQVAIADTDPVPNIRVFDSNEPQSQSQILAIMSTEVATEISNVTYSNGGTRLLVEATNNQSDSHWFHVTLDGAETEIISLNEVFDLSIDKVIFGTSATSLAAQANGQLHQLDTESLERRDYYQGEVGDFAVDSSGALYLTRQHGSQTELIKQAGLGTQQVINTLEGDRNIMLETTRYQDETTLLVHDTGRRQLTLYSAPESDQPQSLTFPAGVADSVISNPNGRIIHQYSGSQVRVYDVRRDLQHTFTLPAEPDIAPQWIRQNYLATVIDNEMIMYDFDGSNQEYLTHAEPVLVFTNTGSDELFSLRKHKHANQSMQLQRSSLSSD